MKHINPGRTLRAIAVASAMAATTAAASGGEPSPLGEGMAAPAAATSQVLTLDQCLTEAMHNSHRRPASKFAVAMAEAQHRQALAGYWPQLSGKAGVEHMNEAPDFLFPASSFKLPAQTIPLPSGFSIPLNGPGGITVPLASIPVPAQKISVPVEDVKLMDPDSFLASMNLTWLLYDGGMRKGFREQAQGWLDMSKQEARRTDLEIADSVKRYYYGSVLARQLHQVGDDTLARMEATLNLTETMYKEGSGKVKKTDFLDNKIMVETFGPWWRSWRRMRKWPKRRWPIHDGPALEPIEHHPGRQGTAL
jgi:outer membrane protein